ncbi:Uncharacterised protein [Actinobacillus pleuropneumoniae]|nr:Uncharacterised protein [Actinobacillus pleuropneumoniae]
MIDGGKLHAQFIRTFFRQERIESKNVHAESLGAFSHFAADPSHAHDAQRFVAELYAEEGFAVPGSAYRFRISLRDMAGKGNHHSKRMLCRRNRVAVRCIDNNDPALCCRFKINVVHAYAGTANHLEVGSCIHDAFCNTRLTPNEESVVFTDNGSELVFAKPGFFVYLHIGGVH